jgi:F0F1-type ATP synthase membrane subunit b/b'
MALLNSLGINSTLFIHLACFIVSYLCLYVLVFKPYSAALIERRKRTDGQENDAARLTDEVAQLQSQFETKARAVNAEINRFYEETRTQAMREHDRLMSEAQLKAQAAINSARESIGSELTRARAALQVEVPHVGAAIASKVSGKEISL